MKYSIHGKKSNYKNTENQGKLKMESLLSNGKIKSSIIFNKWKTTVVCHVNSLHQIAIYGYYIYPKTVIWLKSLIQQVFVIVQPPFWVWWKAYKSPILYWLIVAMAIKVQKSDCEYKCFTNWHSQKRTGLMRNKMEGHKGII